MQLPQKYKLACPLDPDPFQQVCKMRGFDPSHSSPPEYSGLHDPFLLPNCRIAVDRLYNAIKNNEKIIIYTDYDADGIPSASIMNDFLHKLNFKNFEVYIPHRHDEGFGINANAVQKFVDSGVNLLISIDTGTSDIDNIKLAQDAGLDVIVLDHHTPSFVDGAEKLPAAFAIVNHKIADSKYPEQILCAAGVTFRFISAFLSLHRAEYNILDGWEKWLLDRVAISTISDMVPIVNENRVLVHFGLIVLRQTQNRGLQKLIASQRIKIENISEDDVAFLLSPKINAASRMAHPMRAFNLLAADNESDAQSACNHLLELNQERKKRVSVITREAHKKLQICEECDIIVIGDAHWSVGVLGLVASRLSEESNKPVFLWSREGDIYKGSCRAPNGFDAVVLMQKCPADTFIQYGGHSEAGGFTCNLEQIHKLQDTLNQTFLIYNRDTKSTERIIDAELQLENVNLDFYNRLRVLAPFGVGNPKPLFLFKDIFIKGNRAFGNGLLHRELEFENGAGGSVRAISFFVPKDSILTGLQSGDCTNIIATLERDDYRGGVNLKIEEAF